MLHFFRIRIWNYIILQRTEVGSIDADFFKTYLSDKEVKSLEELTEDDRYLFLNDDQRDFISNTWMK